MRPALVRTSSWPNDWLLLVPIRLELSHLDFVVAADSPLAVHLRLSCCASPRAVVEDYRPLQAARGSRSNAERRMAMGPRASSWPSAALDGPGNGMHTQRA